MNSDKNIENLLEVSNLRKDIKSYFRNKVLSDQGLQTELTKVFKPIIDPQNKNAAALIEYLKESANVNNKLIIDWFLNDIKVGFILILKIHFKIFHN